MKTDIKMPTLLSLIIVCAGQRAQTDGSGSALSPPALLCAVCANAAG